MLFAKLACAAALTAAVCANPAPAPANNAGSASSSTTLDASAIQKGSFNDGRDETGAAEVGQAKSLTSQNNFINNCAGKTLTNGLQILTGSCNGIPMGDIPAKTNMVSSVITFPTTGGKAIESDTTFNISVQMSNIVAGSFTNADATYYAAPQFLQGGIIVGHTHVTVQDMGSSLNPTQPLDPTVFAFFKGINDAGNGQGLLQAVVNGGLPAGNYRVCTLAAASNHQPVLMPVAQRGTQDDCTKFVVSGSGTTANVASNAGTGGLAAAALAAAAVKAGPDVSISAATVAAAVATPPADAGKGGKGANTSAAGKGGKAISTGAAGDKGGKATESSVAPKATGKAAGAGAGAKAAGGAKGGDNKPTAGGKQGKAGKARRSRTFIA